MGDNSIYVSGVMIYMYRGLYTCLGKLYMCGVNDVHLRSNEGCVHMLVGDMYMSFMCTCINKTIIYKCGCNHRSYAGRWAMLSKCRALMYIWEATVKINIKYALFTVSCTIYLCNYHHAILCVKRKGNAFLRMYY